MRGIRGEREVPLSFSFEKQAQDCSMRELLPGCLFVRSFVRWFLRNTNAYFNGEKEEAKRGARPSRRRASTGWRDRESIINLLPCTEPNIPAQALAWPCSLHSQAKGPGPLLERQNRLCDDTLPAKAMKSGRARETKGRQEEAGGPVTQARAFTHGTHACMHARTSQTWGGGKGKKRLLTLSRALLYSLSQLV